MRFSGDTIGRKAPVDVEGVFPPTINPVALVRMIRE